MTIKETAGKILLYFYQLQRTVPLSMDNRQIGFIGKKDGTMSLTSDKKWLTNNLSSINNSAADVFNAFTFLLSKGYIQSKGRASSEARVYMGIQLSGAGVDIIEGIERGQDGRDEFYGTFNIKVEGSMDVEALIAEHLSTLSK